VAVYVASLNELMLVRFVPRIGHPHNGLAPEPAQLVEIWFADPIGRAGRVKPARACTRPNGIKAPNSLAGCGPSTYALSGVLHSTAIWGEIDADQNAGEESQRR
jgi:hypothetical protein